MANPDFLHCVIIVVMILFLQLIAILLLRLLGLNDVKCFHLITTSYENVTGKIDLRYPFVADYFLKIQISKETCSQRHIYSICFKFSIIIWIYYCLSFKIFYVDNPNWPSHGRDPYDMCLSLSNLIMHPVVGRGTPMLRK